MSNKIRAYKFHRWLGMIVGIQIVLWIAGGVVMSAIPIDMVRGWDLIHKHPEPFDDAQGHKPGNAQSKPHLVDMGAWRTLSYYYRLNQTVLKAKNWDGEEFYLNPKTMNVLPLLSQNQILALAKAQLKEPLEIKQVVLLSVLPREVGHLPLPMYKVMFDDWKNTTLYVSPKSGLIRSVRTDIWRFYDFFWMLHIMDYDDRDDFNNPLLILAAILALLMVTSGLMLLYWRVVKPSYTRFIRVSSD